MTSSEHNGGSDPFVLDEPMDLGLPVDDEKIAEEIRIRNEVSWGYFQDDYTVLGHCPHGVDLDREFCPKGCRV